MQWHQLSTPNNAKEKLWMEGIAQVSKLAQDIPKQGHRAYALTFGACLHWALRIRWLLDSCVDHIISEITSILNRFHRQDEASYFVSMVPGRRCLPHATSRNSTDKKIIDIVVKCWSPPALQPLEFNTAPSREAVGKAHLGSVAHTLLKGESKCIQMPPVRQWQQFLSDCNVWNRNALQPWKVVLSIACSSHSLARALCITMPLPSMYIRSLAICFEHNDTPTSARTHTHTCYIHTLSKFFAVSRSAGV